MRTLVFLLALANLLFYAFGSGLLGTNESPDALRIKQQHNPELIRIVSRGESSAPGDSATADSENSPATPAEPDAAPPPAPAPASKEACLRWEAMGKEDAQRLSSLLASDFPAFTVEKSSVPSEGAGWWVFIPPLPGKAEAEKKTGELRRLGISDYFVLQEAGANHLAISLGIFSSEKGAQERLAELKAKGVKSARLMPRPGKGNLTQIQARGPEGGREQLSNAAHQALPSIQLGPCP